MRNREGDKGEGMQSKEMNMKRATTPPPPQEVVYLNLTKKRLILAALLFQMFSGMCGQL